MPSLIGETLGQYRIVDEIGSGGMATVYKAHQPSLDRHVAIKILAAKLAKDDVVRQRFDREAKAVAAMSHPHILPVYDFGDQDGLLYIVSELVGGGTLKERLGQQLDPRVAARVAHDIALALEYAHRQGIIHRDVKPANILITRDGRALLSDFGVAKIVANTQHTETGTSLGTPAYMSPEQGRGESIDHRSDIYSLGIILFEMLVGHAPFQGDTPLGILYKQAFAPVASPRELNPKIPRRLEKVVLKALAKEPGERYRSAREMAQALAQAVDLSSTDELPIALPDAALTQGVTPDYVETAGRLARTTTRTAAQVGRGALRALGGIGALLLRVLVVLLIVLLILGGGAIVGGAAILSSFAERTIPTYADDLAAYDAYGVPLTITEIEMDRDVGTAIEPYALDTVQDLRFDFDPPESVELHASVLGKSVCLQGRVELQDGVVSIYFEHLNDVPLYIVGGILSNGINRGIEQLFGEAHFSLERLELQDTSLVVQAPGSLRPTPTPAPTATLRPSPTAAPTELASGLLTVVNEVDEHVVLEIAGDEWDLEPGESLELELAVDSYPYVYTFDAPGYQPGRGTLRVGPGKSIFRLTAAEPTLSPLPTVRAAATATLKPTTVARPKATATPTIEPTRAPNCPHPGARITAPGVDTVVQGDVTIRGTADIPNFDYYKIELRRSSRTRTWEVLGELQRTVVRDGTLYVWDSRPYPSGTYTLQLVVVDITGNYQSCQVRVRVVH
ncbi:MAG: serine/threonine protein kinase [Anaerolineae bacterium]|nr:serine/threonine protein kinase [Anaerolineae bacterium]